MNYKYRMHDPRIGRFFALDPLAPKYPHNSPYAFSENRVIDGVELEGLEFTDYRDAGNGQTGVMIGGKMYMSCLQTGPYINKQGAARESGLWGVTPFGMIESAIDGVSYFVSQAGPAIQAYLWTEYASKTHSGYGNMVNAYGDWANSSAYGFSFFHGGFKLEPSLITNPTPGNMIRFFSGGLTIATGITPAFNTTRMLWSAMPRYMAYAKYSLQPGTMMLGFRVLEVKKYTTAIGRMDDLVKYDSNIFVDSWRKTGTINPNGQPVTWAQNKAWLDARIQRGDNFILTTNPAKLPPVVGGYKAGVPNGYFTAREYSYLINKGIPVKLKF